MPKKEHVALTRCFYCLEGDRILLAKTYTHEGEPVKDLKPFNNKVLDMDPCQKCADWMKKGIILIGIDNAKSDPDWNTPPNLNEDRKNWLPNPWRSGAFSVIKEEPFKRLFPEEFHKFALERRFMFMEHEAMVMTGIIPAEGEEDGREGDTIEETSPTPD